MDEKELRVRGGGYPDLINPPLKKNCVCLPNFRIHEEKKLTF